MTARENARAVRFDCFELRFESGELWKRGQKIPLPHQAQQLLLMLLERPGEVITREQVQALLWPDGTVVEFDHGINSSIRRLRAALNDSAERPRYIETLPKRGYRFIYPCEVDERSKDSRPPQPQETAPNPSDHERQLVSPRTKRWTVWLAGAVGFAAVLLWAVTYDRAGRRNGAITSIAVLPFSDGPGTSTSATLGDDLCEGLIHTLSQIPGLKVIARPSAFRFKGQQIDPVDAGRKLGVSGVLTGLLTQTSNGTTITADLVRVADGTEVWGQRFQVGNLDLQTVQGEIARRVALKLPATLTVEQQERLSKPYTQNKRAYDLYLQGVRQAILTVTPQSLQFLQQAVAVDPNFALAYGQLARGYAQLADQRVLATKEADRHAREAADKAISLDERLGIAHLALGQVAMHEWTWTEAEKELKRAVELNTPGAHGVLSFYLMMIGRVQEGLVENERSAQLDPLSADEHNRVAWGYYEARDYARALQEERAAEANGGPAVTLPWILEQLGQYEEAIAGFKKLGDSAGVLGHLGHVYAVWGHKSEAQQISRELQKRVAEQQLGAYEVAFLCTALGQTDKAFEWLEKAYDQRDTGIMYLKLDPGLDPLRSDPRFANLLRRVGLPQ